MIIEEYDFTNSVKNPYRFLCYNQNIKLKEFAMSITDINSMPIAEKFLMMEQLWESMSRDAQNNGFSPSWHFDVLNDREEKIAKGTSSFSSLDEARARLQKLVK